MKPSVRLLTVSAILGITLVLAFVPLGIGGQNQSGSVASVAGPEVAHAQVPEMSIIISDPITLFGNNRVGLVSALVQCQQSDILIIRDVITQTFTGGSVVVGEAHAAGRCSGDLQTVKAVLTPRTPAARWTPGFAEACATLSTKSPGITITVDRQTDSAMWCGPVILGDPIRID